MNTFTTPAALPPVPRRKSNAVWWILAAIMVLGVGSDFKRKAGGQIVSITTEKAITKTITQIVSATGKIQPEVEVKIAPEVSGEITFLGFREGAVVKKDDLLLEIKP